MIRYMARTAASASNQDPDKIEAKLSPEWLAGMTRMLKENGTQPTRLDTRFPNTNQAQNCWCVGGARRAAAEAGRQRVGGQHRALEERYTGWRERCSPPF